MATSSTHTTTRIHPEKNCTSTNTVHWFGDSVALQSNGAPFEMKKYYRENISLMIETFHRQADGSIVSCKVEEPAEGQWSINILFLPALCNHKRSAKGENTTLNKTCKFSHGNPNVTVISVNASSCSPLTAVNKPEIDIPLCEVVNRADLGARQFVGSATGHFKVEILYPASIRKYYIEDIYANEWNVTSNRERYIRLNCYGDGNPPPVMKLIKDEAVVLITNTSVQHKIQFTESEDFGVYTCIASNELGSDNKSINVNPQKIDSHREDFATINNMAIYVVSGVVALALVSLLVHRFCRMVNCCRPLSSTEIVSLPMEMVTIATSEQTAVNAQTTEEVPARRTGSVHLYESIPPSPIADISFSDTAVDNDLVANIQEQIADSGRYESLDRGTRENVQIP